MPLISSIGDRNVRVKDAALVHAERAVITSTIFTGPSQAAGSGTTAVPVGAIAGGVVAGALLAILVTIGWVWWGKEIKRTHAKQQREVESLRRTRHNTLQNARISKPRIQSYRPLFPRPPEKKVKFAGFDHTKVNEKRVDNTKDVPPISFVREPKPAGLPQAGPVIFPKRASGTRHSTPRQGCQVPESHSQVTATEMRSSSLVPSKKLPHKPSTIDSVSIYSTASGEEHQVRAPTNLILAALGNLGSSVDATLNRNSNGDRHSWSSGWSLFSRNNQSVGANTRLSQASYESTSGAPVGTAL